MKEQIWLTILKYLWLSPNISWALIFCIHTCVYNFKSYWHKLGKRNMSAKGGMLQ